MKTTEELKLIDIDKLIPFDKDYNIIVGHGRVMTSKGEGIKEVHMC